MITGVALVCVWVPDHDAGYDFYVGTLGLKVSLDAPMEGSGRWLVVHAPAQPEVPIDLCVPGPPLMDEKKAAGVRELIAAGQLGVGPSPPTTAGRLRGLKAKGVEVHRGADRTLLRNRRRLPGHRSATPGDSPSRSPSPKGAIAP